MAQDLIVERHGHVFKIIFNRPSKRNALTRAMFRGLIEAIEEADRDRGVNAIMLSGSSGIFSAGTDIPDFVAQMRAGPDLAVFDFVKAMVICDTPIVAAVEGLAVGLGTTMLFHCDLVYVAPGATFLMPFIDMGVVPDAGSTLLVPRRCGMARASELLLLGNRRFGSEDAVRFGIANAVVSADSLFSHAMRQAEHLATRPLDALRAARRLMRGDSGEIIAQMEAEREAFRAALETEEARAAFQTFLKSKTAAV
jgi:enoyl-CoA hydratase/carnithine racemase